MQNHLIPVGYLHESKVENGIGERCLSRERIAEVCIEFALGRLGVTSAQAS